MAAHTAHADNICVHVRFRPANAQELAWERKNAGTGEEFDEPLSPIEFGDREGRIYLHLNTKTYPFDFNLAFPSYTPQFSIFSKAVMPMIDNIFAGVNSAFIACEYRRFTQTLLALPLPYLQHDALTYPVFFHLVGGS